MGNGTFNTFRPALEGIHNSGHVWVGGSMGGILTAPTDPIFWMHHAEIDRIWAEWQRANPGQNPSLAGAAAIHGSMARERGSHARYNCTWVYLRVDCLVPAVPTKRPHFPSDRYQGANELLVDLHKLKKESETKELISKSTVGTSQPKTPKPTYLVKNSRSSGNLGYVLFLFFYVCLT